MIHGSPMFGRVEMDGERDPVSPADSAERAAAGVAGMLGMVRSEAPANEREVRAAIGIAGLLYLVGALLCANAALLPQVPSPAGVIAVAMSASLTGVLLLIAASRRRGGLWLACAADLWGVVLIGVLCASSGGPASPFALIYFFAIGHAAAFQPRSRFVLVCTVALLAYLAPLAYEADVPSTFGAVSCVGIVMALLASLVVHLSFNRLREQRRRLQILVAASASLDRSLDPAQTLSTMANMVVPALAELCVIDLLDQDGSVAVTVAAATDPAIAEGVQSMRGSFPLDMDGDHPVARVLSGRAASVVVDLTDAATLARAAQSGEHERFMRDAGYTRAAVFPLVARGRTHGAISFLRLRSEAPYDRNLLFVLEDLAGRAALAYDNARLYAERAQVARTLRRSLMPVALPTVTGLELASYFRPSDTGSEVGGDFYDVFEDRDGCWLVVGDVCGKGAEAAALTGFLRHTTAAYAREGASPGSVLELVNRAMLEQDFDGRFATVILARVSPNGAGAHVTVAQAGHPGALVVRADGRQVSELGAHGSLLGVFADAAIEEARCKLAPGDALTLYTDGLSEARAPARMLTVADMEAQLRRVAPGSAGATVDALLELIGPEDGVRDDIAILSARVAPPTSADSAPHV
jgi:hypothetical protein